MWILEFPTVVIRMLQAVNITQPSPAPACWSWSPTAVWCARGPHHGTYCLGWPWLAAAFGHVCEALPHSWQTWAPHQKSSCSNCFLPSPPPGAGAVASPSTAAGLCNGGGVVPGTTAAISWFSQVMCNVTSNQASFSPELAEDLFGYWWIKTPTAGWKHLFPAYSHDNLASAGKIYLCPQEHDRYTQGHKNCILQIIASPYVYPSWDYESFQEYDCANDAMLDICFQRAEFQILIDTTWILSVHGDLNICRGLLFGW